MKEPIKKAWKLVRHLPNVNGISEELQPRIKGGIVLPDTKVIRVYVTQKLPESQLAGRDIIPKMIDKYETDIVPIGEMKALTITAVDRTARLRPAPAGVSIGHYAITAGTLGWFVKDNCNLVILSNNHVLANQNKGKAGDAILQPGSYDGGKVETDTIAQLLRFVQINFASGCLLSKFFARQSENKVDCAIAQPKNLTDITLQIAEAGSPVGERPYPEVGDSVWKSGRTTGITRNGIVRDINWYGSVTYDNGIATFTDQILIEASGFSQGGDSGSLIIDNNNFAVGLLFAGSSIYTIANRLEEVEKALGIKLAI